MMPYYSNRQESPGCLIWLIIIIVGSVLLVRSVDRAETKERNERAKQILESTTVDGIYYQQKDDHMVVIGLADFNITYVVIPEEIDGVPVTAVVENAFKDEKIVSVVLPPTIQELGRSAFSTCRELQSINLPEGITEIPRNCFILCGKLQNVNIPKSVTTIRSSAFDGTLITKADLTNVTTLEDNAFAGCPHLTSVKLSPDLKELGMHAFSCCTGLTEITVPESVVTIGKECFEYCKQLKSVSLPDSLTDLGVRSFRGCEALSSIRIPQNVKKLDSQMFLGDSSLITIELPLSCKIPDGKEPFISCSARLVFY